MKLLARGPGYYLAQIEDREIALMYGQESIRDVTLWDKNGTPYCADQAAGGEISIADRAAPYLRGGASHLRKVADQLDREAEAAENLRKDTRA